MMPGGKGKPLAALVLSARPKGEKEPEEGEDDIGLESAAEDILAAVKEDNPKALAAALRAAVTMCQG